MSLENFVFDKFRTIGLPGRLIVATSFAAAVNFGEIFLHTINRPTSRSIEGYTIIFCYFGPPPSFYPRFFIACSLVIATIGALRRSFPRNLIAVAGVFAGLTVYGYWWIDSYRVFGNLADAHIAFINHPEIPQTAYLYWGTWLDTGIAASVFVCAVLLLDRFFNSRAPHSI